MTPVLQLAKPSLKLPGLRTDAKFDALIMLDPTISLAQQGFDLFDIRRRYHMPGADVRRQRPLNVEGAMLRNDLVFGPLLL